MITLNGVPLGLGDGVGVRLELGSDGIALGDSEAVALTLAVAIGDSEALALGLGVSSAPVTIVTRVAKRGATISKIKCSFILRLLRIMRLQKTTLMRYWTLMR